MLRWRGGKVSAKRKIKCREGSVGVKIVERQKKQGVGVRKDKF